MNNAYTQTQDWSPAVEQCAAYASESSTLWAFRESLQSGIVLLDENGRMSKAPPVIAWPACQWSLWKEVDDSEQSARASYWQPCCAHGRVGWNDNLHGEKQKR